MQACAGLCVGISILSIAGINILTSWWIGELSTQASAGLLSLALAACMWIRSHYASDVTNSHASYNSSILYAASWVALVVSEICLFSGIIGPAARAALTWVSVTLESLVQDLHTLYAELLTHTAATAQSLTSSNTTLLWSSGVVTVLGLLEYTRGSIPALSLSSAVVLLLATLFLSCQGGEFQHLAWCLAAAAAASLFYSLTGLHGSHVVVGHSGIQLSLGLNYSISIASVSELVTAAGYSGLSVYWHFVDCIWVIVGYMGYLGWQTGGGF